MNAIRATIKIIKKFIPKTKWDKLKLIKSEFNTKLYYKKIYIRYKIIAFKLRKKEKIKVAFFLIHDSVWKYDGVYRLMEENERFEPIVVVCPLVSYGEETMLHDMNQAYNSFKSKGYNVIKTLNEETGKWLDVKAEIKPDIVFFTNPWELTRDEYYIRNFTDNLTCFVPYFFHVTKHLTENYAGVLQNTVWKAFYETNTHLKFAQKFSLNKACNVTITGYPGLDPFLFPDIAFKEVWRTNNKKMKKIIWAPHHTIDGEDSDFKLSNFKKYAELFLELIEKYSIEIQFAFKPHPLLKSKLNNDPEWGYEKTNEYYQKWTTYDNTILVVGPYVELFIASDAMIHDSGSFTVEYLTINRPVLYTLSSEKQLDSLNDFGKEAVKQHYLAYNENDIIRFIEENVLKNYDPMKSKRTNFVNNNLVPPNNRSASENIYNELLRSLGYIKK